MKQKGVVLENALQVLMDHGCRLHDRTWKVNKHLTRIENPAGSAGLWTDEQIIRKALELEPDKPLKQ